MAVEWSPVALEIYHLIFSVRCSRHCGLRTVSSPAVKCVSRDSTLAAASCISYRVYAFRFAYTHNARHTYAAHARLFRSACDDNTGGSDAAGHHVPIRAYILSVI